MARIQGYPDLYFPPPTAGTYKARQGERHLDFWRQHLPGETLIYVLECGDSIKVGIAKDVPKRIASLQTGNPKRLYLLHVLPGDRRIEKALHRKLRKARGIGEWFAGPEVKDFLPWIERECEKAVSHFTNTGEPPPPCIPPADKRPTSGLRRAPGISTPAMGARWRTSDGKTNPVKVRFIDPAA